MPHPSDYQNGHRRRWGSLPWRQVYYAARPPRRPLALRTLGPCFASPWWLRWLTCWLTSQTVSSRPICRLARQPGGSWPMGRTRINGSFGNPLAGSTADLPVGSHPDSATPLAAGSLTRTLASRLVHLTAIGLRALLRASRPACASARRAGIWHFGNH